MNKEEIDEFLKILSNEDAQAINRFIREQLNFETDYDIGKDYELIGIKGIARKIEEGDYKYFLDNVNGEIKCVFLCYFSIDKNEDKKNMIENGNLDSYYIIALLKSINEPEYTKQIIERWKEFNLKVNNIVELIGLINEPEYTKQIIERWKEFNFKQTNIVELVELINKRDYTLDIIERREEFKIEFPTIEALLRKIKEDQELIIQLIENKEKYRFTVSQIKDIIKDYLDESSSVYIKYLIENKDKYELTGTSIEPLLKKINEPEYIKQKIEKREEYKLYKNNIIELIEFINEPEYTKQIIERRKEFKLEIYDIINFIIQINEPEYTKQIIKRREEYGLSDDRILELIGKQDFPNFAIECMKSYKELGYNIDFLDKMFTKFPELFFMEFDNILSIYKMEGETKYKEFIREKLGNVELDENGNPIIPNDLKEAFSPDCSRDIAEKALKRLNEIIKNWEVIKKQIQYNRANSIINGGLEQQGKMKEIVTALNVLKAKKPTNSSEYDLWSTHGAEQIVLDIQYVEKYETATERAYGIAVKMDNTKTEKHFPDFSLEHSDVIVEVLHPQDKSGILLGYDAHCCFRPNGNADNLARNEYSLFQYCLTTPYGGIIRFRGKEDNEVYMGTPILRNGNMLMFHSYETKNSKSVKEVNEALEEAAVQAIKLSNGNIKAVFMTDLYTGADRLNIKDKLEISNIFQAYTEEEYEKYEGMMTNLNDTVSRKNVVLAIEVDGQILTGEKIKEFYDKECGGNEQTFKEKVGLESGKVHDTYEFGKRITKQEIRIENSDLVDTFDRKYKEIEKERTFIAKIIELREALKGVYDEKTITELIYLDGEIIKALEEKPEFRTYCELSRDDLKRAMEQKNKESFNIFTANNLSIIENHYGISEKDIDKILEQEFDEEMSKMEKSKEVESNSAKRARSAIISQIKKNGNREFTYLITKVAKNDLTEEELEELEKNGISTKDYVNLCINGTGKIDSDKVLRDKKANQVRKKKKDKRVRERVVSEILFSDVTDEELSRQVFDDTIKDIKSAIYQYYINKEEDGKITELKKQQIEQKIHNLNLEKNLNELLEKGYIDDSVRRELMEYGVNMEAVYKKYSSMPQVEKRKIRLAKFDRMKANITTSMKKIENWKNIKERIINEEKHEENEDKKQKNEDHSQDEQGVLDKVVFGNKWYIEFIKDRTPNIYLSENATEEEKEGLKIALRQEISKARNSEVTKIDMQTMKQAVSFVTIGDKETASKILEDVIKETDSRGE